MASKEQLNSVGESCSYYDNNSITSSVHVSNRSCETCSHWVNKHCDIDVFDEVLTGLDQG